MPSKVTKKRELKVVSEKFQSDIYIYKAVCEVKLCMSHFRFVLSTQPLPGARLFRVKCERSEHLE